LGIMKVIKILWIFLIASMTVIYLIVPALKVILPFFVILGVITWWLTGYIASSRWILKIWFNLLQIIVPKPSETLEIKSGTFLTEEKIPEKIEWKQALLDEGVNRSFLPILLMFGVLQYVIKFIGADFSKPWESFSLLVFASPLYVCPITFLWILLDSGWIEYDKEANRVIRVGEHILLYLRSIAGLSALIGFITAVLTIFGAVAALLSFLVALAFASVPVYLTTVIYVKFFHYKYVKKVHDYLLLEKKLPVAKVQIVPVSVSVAPTPLTPYTETRMEKMRKTTTVTYKFCPYCGAQIPFGAKFCTKCGSSLKAE